MKIEMREIGKIVPYARNPRSNDAAVDAVAASIREFGWRQPIVVDKKGVIVVGHARWKAAQKLGLKKVPVHVATDMTPAQVKAYRIADNRLAELAEWDMELLPLEFEELKEAGIDLALLGFEPDEVAKLLDPGVADGLTDPDEIPEPPDKAITKPGDLWILGNHRMLCGDAGKAEDVDKLLGSRKIQLINTDPPYNVNLEPRSNNAILAGSGALPHEVASKMHLQAFDRARLGTPKPTSRRLRPRDRVMDNDYLSDDEFFKTLVRWFGQMARVLEPGRCFYIWGGYLNWPNYCPALALVGLYFSQGIIWIKNHPVLGRKDFMNDAECCWYGWREGGPHKFLGPSNAVNVWQVKKVNPQDMVHLTEKPVELAVRAITYSSRAGENVFDPFAGSGSTLIACEETKRRASLMEIDPPYCDVIVDRWQKFTGKKAKRHKASDPSS